MYISWANIGEKKANETRAIAVAALLGREAIKE